MKLFKITIFLLMVSFALTTTACAQRVPKPKTAQGSIKNYFQNYGDDYEETEFGRFKIDEVEVTEVHELQNGLVWVEAFVSLDEGNIVYKVGATLEKRAIRWRVISWENLGRAS